MDNTEICTICLEELEEDCYHDVATLSCSHKFHIMCILEWFQNKDITLRIIGVTKKIHVEEVVESLNVKLKTDDIKRLEESYKTQNVNHLD